MTPQGKGNMEKGKWESKNKARSSEGRLVIGGQAVIEGVMMRSPRWTSTAVRRRDGGLVAYTQRFDSLMLRYRWLRAPVLRGVIVLYDALVIGIRALLLSANASVGAAQQLTSRQVAVLVGAGLAMAIGLFFVLPTVAIRLLERHFASAVSLNLAEGAIRVGVLVAYIGTIGRVPDVGRVFAYHGAEHKAVNAYEAGAPLEVPTVRAHSRFHPRCGTSFLLIVMIVATVVFSFFGRPALALRILSRIMVLPLVAGVSYEIIRAGARHRGVRPLVAPGLWLQQLTTREPDDTQLEVAIRAIREVVEREKDGEETMVDGR